MGNVACKCAWKWKSSWRQIFKCDDDSLNHERKVEFQREKKREVLGRERVGTYIEVGGILF